MEKTMIGTKEVTFVARKLGIEYKRAYRNEGSRTSRVKLYDVKSNKVATLKRELRMRFGMDKVVEIDAPFGNTKSLAVYF
jgi:hypothetical protein